ncbi:monofunctional biosynthetic peptidoglycan transglycosylase [Flavobacterium sediminilitoris]|uniref:Biosynthetic peptidoglycan transglycosylase n=1 Tax=Flavobacterium sediminilitoris TaxID=2024526 RepID=A0ABY4HPQ6_9FLAO|nr:MULTISPECIES: monofunctional biosynthetic peptidoglycan transglycosylase [Flavobacterium]UOX34683.1 monofunctional biosynthetic peptidoglycan transglycosylase [Flavobacterium sediminilitoris]
MAKKTASKKKTTKTPVKRTAGQKIFRFVWKLILWFNIVSVFFVLLYKFVPVPFTPLMIIRAFEQKANGKEMTCSHDWVSIENISPNLQKAVIASEDGLFLEHNGFDFKSMQKAYEGNQKGKKIKGGSTISQQTAKNVFLWQGRSYLRKGLEAYYTLLIELLWSKERIMEVYLNSIEMGDGVYGAQAASKYWYHKEAKNLSRIEAAGIAVILPNPRKFKASNSSAYINRRKAKISKYIGYVDLKY